MYPGSGVLLAMFFNTITNVLLKEMTRCNMRHNRMYCYVTQPVEFSKENFSCIKHSTSEVRVSY